MCVSLWTPAPVRSFLCCLLLGSLATSVKLGEWFWDLIRFLSRVNTDARHFLRFSCLFSLPFEEDNISLEVTFDALGTVKSVKKQTYVSHPNVFNGTRLVNVVLSGVLPRFPMVNGYLCRLWYRGQPLVCNLSAVQRHKSANCPIRTNVGEWANRAFASNCTSVESAGDSGDLPPLGSSAQAAETGGSNDSSVSNDSVDLQLLKDNELDLVESQSILRDVDPAGSSVEEEPISKSSKRAWKDKGSSAKRSNFS